MKPTSFSELFEEARGHEDYDVAGAMLELTEGVVREMERQGINREELARRLDVSPAYVTKILCGKANFTLATMVGLARALGAEMHVRINAGTAVSTSQAGDSSSGLDMWIDPIVDEVRKVRDEHAARFDYDLERIFRDLCEQEKQSGRPTVFRPPKRPASTR